MGELLSQRQLGQVIHRAAVGHSPRVGGKTGVHFGRGPKKVGFITPKDTTNWSGGACPAVGETKAVGVWLCQRWRKASQGPVATWPLPLRSGRQPIPVRPAMLL